MTHFRIALHLGPGQTAHEELHKDTFAMSRGWQQTLRKPGVFIFAGYCKFPDDQCPRYLQWKLEKEAHEDDVEAEAIARRALGE